MIETSQYDRSVLASTLPWLPVVLWVHPGAIGFWSPAFSWRSDK